MDRFVVGTGRCGSTLLSRMLAQNPATCALFEYFTGLDQGRRFSSRPIGGAAFADLIAAEQPMLTAVLRRGYPVEEVTYPFDRGRFARDTATPWICVSTLPRLSDDPDALFDEVMAQARAQPTQPAPAHHRMLFDWLVRRTGRAHWVERSGSSIEYLEDLLDAFPAARFVHIHRDGPEAALSMRQHHAYRLPISILYGAPVDDGRALGELGPLDVTAPPTADDPISLVLASRPPASYFGRYWSDQLLRGFRALRRLEPAHYLEVRFEDLLADPEGELRRIARFFALLDGDWIVRAARLVRGASAPRASELPSGEHAALVEACRPGMMLVGRA